MKLKLPKHVHGFVDRHGKARRYLRRPGGETLPLPGLPYSPEFMAAYEAGMAKVQRAFSTTEKENSRSQTEPASLQLEGKNR